MNRLAALIVVLAGVWLIGLAVAAVAVPERVKLFFDKFASSAFTHFLEMFVRIVVGAALVIYSPQMKLPLVFTVFGWVLLVTTVVLLFVPWKVHRRFADRSLPLVARRMVLFAVVSFFGGIIILFSFILGSDAS